MIKVFAAVVLVLGFSVAAQAGGGAPHFSASAGSYTQSAGAGGGGGVEGGLGTLMHIAPTRFAMRDVTGSATDYVPSTFVSYDSALAEGKASLAAHPQPQPLGTSAQEGSTVTAKSANVQIVQKQDGAAAIRKR